MTRFSILVVPLLLASGCLDAPETESETAPGVYLNGVYLNGVYLNGLLGTPESIKSFLEYPLATETFVYNENDSKEKRNLSLQLEDENSRDAMAYIVGCALNPKQSVSYVGHEAGEVAGETFQWTGQMGLCPKWNDDAPSVACQETVSACLLARQNPKQKSVMLRLATQLLDGSAIPLADRVTVKTIDSDGEPIDSATCEGNGQDCGFDVSHSFLGVCNPGQKVTVSCDKLPSGTTMRACDGVEACDSSTDFAQRTCGSKWSGGFVSKANAMTFTCNQGTFGVMLKPGKTSLKERLPLVVNAIYPATELEVFDELEGGFYGNIFNSTARSGAFQRSVELIPDGLGGFVARVVTGPGRAGVAIYEDTFSCFSPKYTDLEAIEDHRLCAVMPVGIEEVEMCVGQSAGYCGEVCNITDDDPLNGDGDYSDCADTEGAIRGHVMSTYLDDACGVLQDASGNYAVPCNPSL